MNDQELREMIRESIARHVGRPGGERSVGRFAPPDPRVLLDPSHALLPVVAGGEASGACLIEPSVSCTHCGYCKSFGH